MTTHDINRFVNSRAMVAILGTAMLVAARLAFQRGGVTYFDGDRGLLFESANLWVGDHWLTMVFSTAIILGVSLVWMLIIQIFNPFRALTTLGTSFFMVMMASTPDLLDQLYSGTLLVAAIPMGISLLWTSFANPWRMRHIFLLFTALSALTMTQYCFAVYIPVFIVGCAQMKIFSLRTVIATILGIITPWWIVFGLGLASPGDIHLPEITAFFTSMDFTDTIQMFVVVLLTVTLAVAAWFGNVMKVIGLNANLRAFNGSLSLILLATVLAVFLDFTNAASYLPTLYLMTSYQLSLLFGTNHGSRRFVPILVIIGAYVALFAWSVY